MLEILIIFTLGYLIGAVSALTVIALTLASRNGSTGPHRPTTTKHP